MLGLAATAGCTPSLQGVRASTPEWDAGGQHKCSVATTKAEPLVVEWPSADRAKLEALTKEGLVAVKYSGCEMAVLGACKAKGAYRYVGTTLKKDVVHIEDADELYAKLPFGAARLEATLKQSGSLDVSMSIVGRFASSELVVHEAELEGTCAGATHVISALTVGAFEFSSRGGQTVGGRVTVFDVGGGASTDSSKQVITKDGDEERCTQARDSDQAPPESCRALLRVEVTPIPEVDERTLQARLALAHEFDDRRAAAKTRRTLGWVTAGVGGAVGITGGVLGWLASSKVSDIRSGGLATSGDIESTRSTANGLATAAWVTGSVGLATLAGGFGLVLLSNDPEEPTLSASVTPGGGTLKVDW